MMLWNLRFVFIIYLIQDLIIPAHLSAAEMIEHETSSLPCAFEQPSSIPLTAEKQIYRIGILAFRSEAIAMKEFQLTFSDYLTSTAGKRFDPPISFELVPVSFGMERDPIDEFIHGDYDFVYTHPGMFSCIDIEIGIQALATVITSRKFHDQEYFLTEFGGVIFTRADNDDINVDSVSDLKDKRLGLVSIGGLGSGQMQFREMVKAGLHYLQDPKQLIFLENQNNVISAVLNKEVDAGFVRTDMLERFIDPETGTNFDLSSIKVIGKFDDDDAASENEGDDSSNSFPFSRSTVLYPEWPLGSFPTVDLNVQREVQNSLIELGGYAAAAEPLLECYLQNNCTTTECEDECYDNLNPSASLYKCNISANTTLLAQEARGNGKYVGWRMPLSYATVRNMQDEIGLIQRHEQSLQCVRGETLAESIVCPDGHFKRKVADIHTSCEQAGLPCLGFDCVCKPCVEARDEEFFTVNLDAAIHDGGGDNNNNNTMMQVEGCDKFEICGYVEQNHIIDFRVIDNRQRNDVSFSAKITFGEDSLQYFFAPVETNLNEYGVKEEYMYAFQFDAAGQRPGVRIIEIMVNGEQIPESPFRFEVVERNCLADTDDPLREADHFGNCICSDAAVEIGSTCIPMKTFIPAIFLLLLLVMVFFVSCYLYQKRQKKDLHWKIKEEEINLVNPLKVVGEGKFGPICLGEYRGTYVAMKIVSMVETPSTDKSISSVKRGGEVGAADCSDHPLEVGEMINGKYDHSRNTDDTNGTVKSREDSSSDTDIELGTRTDQSVSISAAITTLGSASKENAAKKAKNFAKEMRLLSQLRHPCITTVMGAVVLPGGKSMLIMEYMELGSLRDVLRSDTMAVDDTQVLSMIKDVAKGLRFLHSANPCFIHGDLKAQNILVDSNFRAKVSDFGLFETKRRKGVTMVVGTPFWMAPELLRGESGNTAMSDIYSFGILLYEAYARSYPYSGEDAKEVLRLVADRQVNKRPPIPTRCPEELAQIMTSCLLGDPEKRPTAAEVDSKLTTASDDGGKAQGLLWQLFPRHVAAKLRDGQKVEPETHEDVTVFVCEVVGFAHLKSILSPIKLSALLDRLYAKFDSLCALHNVFRIETYGDSFMCVTNLAEEQHDHVRIMAAFATDSLKAAACTLIDDDTPSSGYVQIRAGLHTGPVVSHVVGSKTPRYSIIGETVTTARKLMESSKDGGIQCSGDSAALLRNHDKDLDLSVRSQIDAYNASMKTFSLGESTRYNYDHVAAYDSDAEIQRIEASKISRKNLHLIEWNVDVLHRIIREIVAARDTSSIDGKHRDFSHLLAPAGGGTVFDEVKEVVTLPPFDAAAVRRMKEKENITLPPNVWSQLRDFVTAISQMYRDVPFHNFEHASHVTLSVVRLLTSIKAVPSEQEANSITTNKTLHQCSYGIASDPVAQLAIVFSALIHDTDHQGVPNAQLVKEESELAIHYNNRSVAEQNSVDLAWSLFMDPKYSDLRSAIAQTEKEISRFRQLVINSVMATDIVDKELKQLRNGRWEKAFNGKIPETGDEETAAVNRKATIVIEHLIQASDIAHTMQQWHVYRKWNERFFRECYAAYKAGRAETDPSKGWYKGEIGFFDFYIIPLAKKLQESGVFGVYSDEYVKNAQANRDEWERSGERVVEEMLSKVHKTEHGSRVYTRSL